jgi:hypothetical protein
MRNLFFENFNRLIIKDFWMVKIWQHFHKSIWVAILFCFSISFSQKHMFLKALHGALFILTLWGFVLGLQNFKMTSVTLNTSFHIDLELSMCYSKIRTITFF